MIIGAFIDLTGKKVNYLTVLKRDVIKPTHWICKCECGTIKSIIGSVLRNNSIKSCGCKTNEIISKSRIKDMTNQRFNRLMVIERVEKPDNIKNNSTYWLCKCDCGNSKIASRNDLMNGYIQSCGCLSKEILKNNDFNKKNNTYDLTGDYGIGWTVQGEEFLFDLEDYDKIKDYYWHRNGRQYMQYYKKIKDQKRIDILMHRLVLKVNSEVIDHINGIRYDNRKINLRPCTIAMNNLNRKINKNNTSGHKGVYWNSTNRRWRATINIHKKRVNLGSYMNYEDAVKAREEAEEKYFSDYNRSKENLKNINVTY